MDVKDYLVSVGRNSLSDGQQKSRPEQEAINRAAAERYGLPIPDNGYYFDMLSRSEWPRPGLAEALTRIESDPRCRGMVVWNQDRTVGDEHQLLEVFGVLEDSDAYLIEGDPYRVIDVSNEAERLIGLINSWRADQEAKRTRRRVHGTHRQKVLRGKYVSRPVFGLRSIGPVKITDKDENDPARLAARIAEKDRRAADRASLKMVEPEPLKGWIIRDEDALRWVRTMFTWITEGTSAYTVCVRLRDAGVISANGLSDWSTMSVRHTFANPMYMGQMKWDQTKVIRPRNRKTGSRTARRAKRGTEEHLLVRSPFGVLLAVPHEGIDDYDHDQDACKPCQEGIALWEEARLVIDARTTQSDTRRVHPPSVFDPFVRCGRCGKKMYHRKLGRAKRKDGTRQIAFEYRCATRRNTAQACIAWHSVHERYVIEAFEAIASRGTVPDTVTVTMADRDDGLVDERLTLKERLTDLDDERKRAVRLLTKGTITEEEFAEMTREREVEATNITERLTELRPTRSAAVETTLVAERNEAFALAWETITDEAIPVERRQAVLAKLIDRIVLDAPHITIVWASRSPFEPDAQA